MRPTELSRKISTLSQAGLSLEDSGLVLSRHRLPSFVRGVGVAGSFRHRPVRRSLLRPRILASSACWQTLQTPAAPQITRRSLDTKKTYGGDDGGVGRRFKGKTTTNLSARRQQAKCQDRKCDTTGVPQPVTIIHDTNSVVTVLLRGGIVSFFLFLSCYQYMFHRLLFGFLLFV